MKITTIPPAPQVPPPTFQLDLSQAELSTLVGALNGAFTDKVIGFAKSVNFPTPLNYEGQTTLYYALLDALRETVAK